MVSERWRERIACCSSVWSLSFSTCQPALAVGAFREGLAWNCQCILSTSVFPLFPPPRCFPSIHPSVRPSHPHLNIPLSLSLICSYCVSRSLPKQPPHAHAHPPHIHTPCMCEHKHTYTHRRRVWLTAPGSQQCVKTRTARQRSSVTESNAGPASRSHRKPFYFLSLSASLTPFSVVLV